MDPADLPLRDIHLPEAIGWWPPATGWMVLAIVIVVSAGFAVFLYRRRLKTTAEHAAISELDAIVAALRIDGNGHVCAQALSRLARRVSLLYGGPETAAAVGDAWLDTIRKLSGSGSLSVPVTEVLLVAPYSPSSAERVAIEDYRAAAEVLRRWIHDAPRLARERKRHARHAAV